MSEFWKILVVPFSIYMVFTLERYRYYRQDYRYRISMNSPKNSHQQLISAVLKLRPHSTYTDLYIYTYMYTLYKQRLLSRLPKFIAIFFTGCV